MAIFRPKPWVDQNHGLTPLDECQFFDFSNFLFLQLTKAFFRSRISLKTFSWPILPKKERWKNGHFWTKTMGNPFGKMTFITKGNKLFYAACVAYLVSRMGTSGTYISRYLNIRTCDFRPLSVQLRCRANIFLL